VYLSRPDLPKGGFAKIHNKSVFFLLLPMAWAMQKIITYFLRGLLFVTPLAVTVYLFYLMLQWLNNLLPDVWFPGSGVLILLLGTTLVGFIGSRLVFRPIFASLENLMERLPLVNLVYSSLKDLVSAFVGEQKKFNRPVLVTLNKENQVQKLGFVTQNDLSQLNLQERVAVYFPYAYALSGELCIVPTENVIPLETPATEVMKFVISGGVTKI
jgi:uncharacterized membrane protein